MRIGSSLFVREISQTFVESDCPCLVLKTGNTTLATITYLKSSMGPAGRVNSHIQENGFSVSVHLTEPSATCGLLTKRGLAQPTVPNEIQFELVHFHLTRSALDAFTEKAGVQTIEYPHRTEAQPDPLLCHLAEIIIPSIRRKVALPGLFLEHYLQMLCGHFASAYGDISLLRLYRGGLAPWQKTRTLEILEQNLSGDLRLTRLAAECGISASHFCRCFRVSFGTSLHKYVVNKRIERAQQLLLHSQLSIAEISIEAGFSDQAALSRTFAAIVGAPPARWRTEYSVRVRASRHPLSMLAAPAECGERISASVAA